MRISAWSSDVCSSDLSKLRQRVLDVLQREGYIRGYSEEAMGPMKGIRIELKYFEGQPAIQHVARVSKPGRRVYSGAQELPRRTEERRVGKECGRRCRFGRRPDY